MKKRLAAGAIIRNKAGEMMIVKPTYKEGWVLPGGMVKEGESPADACAREVEEELGFKVPVGSFIKAKPLYGKESVTIHLFDCGTLNDQQIAQINLPENELSEFRFLPDEEARTMLGSKKA